MKLLPSAESSASDHSIDTSFAFLSMRLGVLIMTVPVLVPGRGGETAVKTAIKVGRNIVHMNKTLDVVKIVVAC